MDTTLVTVTILSMGMAATLSVIVWRLLRDERRRSEARVLALASAAWAAPIPTEGGDHREIRSSLEGGGSGDIRIAREGGSHGSVLDLPVAPAVLGTRDIAVVSAGTPGITVVSAGTPDVREVSVASPDIPVVPATTPDVPVVSVFRRKPDVPVASAIRRIPADETVAADLPLHGGSEPIITSALFVEPARSSPWGNRLAVMAGLVLLGASVSLFAMAAARSRATSSSAPPSAAALPADAGPGLELLSLRDARQSGTLTITGLVQNARAGSLLSHVAVTAYAFDEKGAFLASGRALIDVTSLAPGDESPFVVNVPVTETVARYRIGFRGDDGRVIAHIDKRQSGPIAALRFDTGQVNR